jgi:hypothetical protein
MYYSTGRNFDTIVNWEATVYKNVRSTDGQDAGSDAAIIDTCSNHHTW